MSKTQLNKKDSTQIINQKIEQHVISSNQKTTITLENGKNATTMAGGQEVPIMYKEVLAGEYIENWNVENITRILTPLVPTMDKIYLTLKAFFVPHTRVWKDAEKALAQKGDYENFTNLNKLLPTTTIQKVFTENFYFKGSLASRYGVPNRIHANTTINILPIRGYRAIENDFFRSKEYMPTKIEYNDNNVGTAERELLNYCKTASDHPTANTNNYILADAKARKSYLNNIKKNLYDVNDAFMEMQDSSGIINEHLDWQNEYNNMKQSIDNADKNDWDIIAEMGGTKPVVNDRVQLLGMLDYELNYQQITQSAPEINSSTPLGTTGGFSYTKANGTLFSHKQFNQHGYIHIMASINMETITERTMPKEILKTEVNDIYRPGLAQKETQVITKNELNAGHGASFLAYQPAWAEYKRLPSMINGEMQTKRLNKSGATTQDTVSNSHWHNAFEIGNIQVMSNLLLNPAGFVNNVLARNNILNSTLGSYTPAISGVYWYDDPIMNISEHKVKVSLPIKSSIINQVEKAEEQR